MCDCRDLGIGGDAHKKIDAAVRKGGFEIVSGPFELGMLRPCCIYVLELDHVLPAWLLSVQQLLVEPFQKAGTQLRPWHGMQSIKHQW